MKKKIFLMLSMVLFVVCLMAIGVSAATPDASKQTVTLSDSTVLPIWDTDGDALIWYKSTANADDGYANYDYIKAQATEVSYETNWSGAINGVTAYQVKTVTVTVNGVSYGKNDIVVFNIKDEDVLVTGTSNKGKPVNCLSETFSNSSSIEYVFLRLDTVALQAKAFEKASNLKYVNLEELTELNQIVSQNFTNCTSFFDGMTLDLSETKLTTLTSGVFNNTPIGELIFPKNLVTLQSWSLQGLTKIKEIHIPESVTSFGDTMFKNCYSLEKVTGYKSLFDRGVINSIGSNMFLDCKALTSVDFPDTYVSIGSSALRGLKAYTGTFKVSNSCTSIGTSALQDTAFDTIIIGTGVETIYSNAFRGASVQYVYISENIVKIEQEVFREVKNKVVVYYTGDSAEALRNVTVINYNGVIVDAATVCVSANEFDLENRENKNYIVFGYDKCEAFYGGHSWKGENNVKLESYFAAINIEDVCENCQKTSVVNTINPIFVWKGYSASTFGEGYSVVQGFTVNTASIEAYKVYAPDFDFGILATVNKEVDEEGNAVGIKPSLDSENVLTGNFVKDKHEYLDIKLTGIPKGQEDTKIVFCVYVTVNGTMYYLDNNTTGESIVGISYNEVLELQKGEVTE